MAQKKNKAKAKPVETEKENASAGGPAKLKAATSIYVRHILCEKHSKKEEALEKLREGMKFDEVAQLYSEDKARQGGLLGWKTRGSLLADFEALAYSLQTSTPASPRYGEVKTREGYHIVMVEKRR